MDDNIPKLDLGFGGSEKKDQSFSLGGWGKTNSFADDVAKDKEAWPTFGKNDNPEKNTFDFGDLAGASGGGDNGSSKEGPGGDAAEENRPPEDDMWEGFTSAKNTKKKGKKAISPGREDDAKESSPAADAWDAGANDDQPKDKDLPADVPWQPVSKADKKKKKNSAFDDLLLGEDPESASQAAKEPEPSGTPESIAHLSKKELRKVAKKAAGSKKDPEPSWGGDPVSAAEGAVLGGDDMGNKDIIGEEKPDGNDVQQSRELDSKAEEGEAKAAEGEGEAEGEEKKPSSSLPDNPLYKNWAAIPSKDRKKREKMLKKKGLPVPDADGNLADDVVDNKDKSAPDPELEPEPEPAARETEEKPKEEPKKEEKAIDEGVGTTSKETKSNNKKGKTAAKSAEAEEPPQDPLPPPVPSPPPPEPEPAAAKEKGEEFATNKLTKKAKSKSAKIKVQDPPTDDVGIPKDEPEAVGREAEKKGRSTEKKSSMKKTDGDNLPGTFPYEDDGGDDRKSKKPSKKVTLTTRDLTAHEDELERKRSHRRKSTSKYYADDNNKAEAANHESDRQSPTRKRTTTTKVERYPIRSSWAFFTGIQPPPRKSPKKPPPADDDKPREEPEKESRHHARSMSFNDFLPGGPPPPSRSKSYRRKGTRRSFDEAANNDNDNSLEKKRDTEKEKMVTRDKSRSVKVQKRRMAGMSLFLPLCLYQS